MADSSVSPAVPSPPRSPQLFALLFLLIVGCLLLVVGLGDVGLTDRDEGSNAEAAREMLETGEWISPTLNDEPRYAKPALVYWVISGTYALFGVNEFTARLPSALFGLGLLIVHYLFLSRVFGATVAWCGSLMLLLNVEFVGVHRMVLTDPALVFFTTSATYGFWMGFHGRGRDRRWFWLFYVGMALATLTKGPVGLLIPLLAVVPYLTLTRQWSSYFATGMPVLGWSACVLLAAPWYVAMFAVHGADYVAAAYANTAGRFAHPMEGHGGTILFYFPILLVGFFPWSGFLPVALFHTLKAWKRFRTGEQDARGERGLLLFCALWVMSIFVFFTISATRLPHYILPLYPPAALLAAVLWSRFLTNASSSGLTVSIRVVLITGYLLSLVLVSVPALYDTFRHPIAEHFPAAERIDVGTTPVVLGAVVFLGVIIFRHVVRKEDRWPQAFGVLSGMMGIFLLIVIVFTVPRFGKFFINPPQELATIAGVNLGPGDRLIHFGRKLPSLSFYAKRHVHFINPGEDEKFLPHVNADGRLMVILPSSLHGRLPDPVASFPPILQRYGFLLLSSDPPGAFKKDRGESRDRVTVGRRRSSPQR